MKKNNVFFLSIVMFILILFSIKGEAAIVSNSTELADAIVQANNGGDKTIKLQDGIYTLDDMLWVEADGVTVYGLSGNRDSVIIRGTGMDGPVSHIFNVAGSRFTAYDMTLRDVANHAVQLQIDVDSTIIRNLHILDTGEQMIKVAYNPDNPWLKLR